MGDPIAQYYENDPRALIWREESGNRREIGLFIGHCIKEELRIPLSQKARTLILSVASNVGVMEQGIQEEAGKDYFVVANDFANLPRLPNTTPLRSDARQLPFADESISCIVDIAGALWHQLGEDKLDRKLVKKSTRGLLIVQHYKQKIKPGGFLLIDDGYEKSTGALLDEIIGEGLDGFGKPILIGENPFILRAYQRA